MYGYKTKKEVYDDYQLLIHTSGTLDNILFRLVSEGKAMSGSLLVHLKMESFDYRRFAEMWYGKKRKNGYGRMGYQAWRRTPLWKLVNALTGFKLHILRAENFIEEREGRGTKYFYRCPRCGKITELSHINSCGKKCHYANLEVIDEDMNEVAWRH